MAAKKFYTNIAGKVFSRLKAVSPVESGQKLLGRTVWRCICSCGNEKEVNASSLLSGNTKSCGCLHIDKVRKHGKTNHPFYNAWRAMHSRCKNPNNSNYANYGERGITVCDEWSDFEVFYNDMFGSWTKGMQIDRINTDGNYEKNNCRWVTVQQNSFNRRGRGGTSKYKGVYWSKNASKWIAKIVKDGKYYHLGSFDEEHLAATAYNEAAIKFHGQYANINNIPPPPPPEQESE